MPVLVEAARARRGTGMLSGSAARAGTMLLRSFLGERDRWVLWLPVALGCGVAGYFGLSVEPPLWSGVAAFVLAVGVAATVRRNAAALLFAIVAATVALGFTAASLRTASVAEPVLARKLGPVMVAGRIVHVDVLPNARRVVLDQVSFAGGAPRPAPSRIRIRLRGQNEELRAGRRLQVRAVLLPPPGPAAPGAFDFQRYLFYRGIGAVGYAIAAPLVLSDGGAGGQPGFAISALRQSIAARVMAALPGATGAVAAALMTGKGSAEI